MVEKAPGTRSFSIAGAAKNPKKKGGKKSPDWGNFICSTQGFQPPPPQIRFFLPFSKFPWIFIPFIPTNAAFPSFSPRRELDFGVENAGIKPLPLLFFLVSLFFFPLPGFFLRNPSRQPHSRFMVVTFGGQIQVLGLRSCLCPAGSGQIPALNPALKPQTRL